MPLRPPADTLVRAAVLQGLLRGETVDPPSLSAITGLTLGTVTAALAALDATGVICVLDGSVRAAYPLSALPTHHKIVHDGTAAYACCAIDALAVPSMVDGDASVVSRCASCDEEVTVEMRHDLILASRPEAPVVFHVAGDCCDMGPTVLVQCPHINFFCGTEHMTRWRSQNPGMTGDALTLNQAVTRAREIFGSTIALVRRGATSTPHATFG
jgi:hypothetical protein